MTAGQYIDVPGIALAVFDGVLAHFAASSTTLPDLRYIGPGATREIAWDCESCLITCGGIFLGQAPGLGGGTGRQTGNPLSAGGTRYALLSVQIVRCLPRSENADALTTAGLAILTDAGLLSQALAELCGNRGALHGAGTAGDVEIIGPSGNYYATEGHLAVTVMNLRTG